MSKPLIMLQFTDEMETERLLLRKPLPGDGKEVNQAIRESWEDLQQWMPWAQQLPSECETEENIRHAYLQFLDRSDLRFHGYDKQTGEMVLCTGFHRIDWKIRKFEIGYWIRKKYMGQGLVTEAVRALENLLIKELVANRIEIRCDAGNDRSANVAKRLGYTLEGTLRLNALDASSEKMRDTLVFAKVRGIEY
ncbi:GNAT family N-acetyltransferase [Brevibacillus sp. SYSU BS000544]|uniref:GNAT family N-acetyltransferase n=1 Tax=Brevibacillus sp. SYSU BS000544 TaxID=3416443 RepID=UPI003CE4DEBA